MHNNRDKISNNYYSNNYCHILYKTSLVALGIAFIIMVFSLKAFKLNLPNVFVFFIISFVISYLIIFMNFQENFSAILYKYLNRDSSFTGRTIIWALALKSISRHPILGNGNVSSI